MPQLLTTNALILCPHGGKGTSVPSVPKWSVNGSFVLVENDVGTLACPFVPLPCGGYKLRSMGLNATRIDGRKAMLATDFNQSFTGLPLIITEFHQAFDNSTPAPLPPGGATTPLDPFLTDLLKPIVTGGPPALAFNLTQLQPAVATATFNLFSDHPLRWILTLINETPPSHHDLTGGLPPNLTLAPSGGAWPTPALTVTLTMTAAYMSSLGLGRHHFFMSGVSRRGLTNFTAIILTVS